MSCARWSDAALLNAVERDLTGWPLIRAARQISLKLSSEVGVQVKVKEKRLFMAAIQSCEFTVSGRCALGQSIRLTARQPGWLRRQPVRFCVSGHPAHPLAAHFNQFNSLRQTVSELDYRRFELVVTPGRWRCAVEPWTASEVICRLPPLRRYLRLEPHQRMLLLSTLHMVAQAMRRLP
ncbi:MAG: DUF3156 family protein [Mixta sp.]